MKIFVIIKRERIKNKSLTYFLKNVKKAAQHQEEQRKGGDRYPIIDLGYRIYTNRRIDD